MLKTPIVIGISRTKQSDKSHGARLITELAQNEGLSTVEVAQADKRRKKQEKLTFIFINSFINELYINSAQLGERLFEAFLKKLGIRYRGPDRARHTFARQLLTKGVAEHWIMREMGHTSIQMFEIHYGRWIDSEMPEKYRSNGHITDTSKYRHSVKN